MVTDAVDIFLSSSNMVLWSLSSLWSIFKLMLPSIAIWHERSWDLHFSVQKWNQSCKYVVTISKTLRIQESNLSLAMKYDSPDNWAYWPDSNIETGSRLKGELYPGISKLSTVYLLNGFRPISNFWKENTVGKLNARDLLLFWEMVTKTRQRRSRIWQSVTTLD